MSEENPKKETLLKGRNNFLAWSTRLETLLTLDGHIIRNDNDVLEIAGATDAAKSKNETAAKKYIIKNCSDEVMHSINPTDDFKKTDGTPPCSLWIWKY
jgi:hypothetical protein